jgi:DNA polymerase-1
MAKVIYSDHLQPDQLDSEQTHWAYNALDCCITYEIKEALDPKLGNDTPVYDFERACLAPAMEMMLRGLRVDRGQLSRRLDEIFEKQRRLEHIMDRYAQALGQAPGFKPSGNSKSPFEFFYDRLKVPKIWTKEKGERKLKMDRETLEKLQAYFYAKPMAKAMLAWRDLDKKRQVLQSGIDSDGRIRCSYNVGGTETGRWSSSKNAFQRGTNLQNITSELRSIFVADPGYKMANADLEQAEARGVAYLSGDEAFIEACESGDLWTKLCKIIWPQLDWTGKEGRREDLNEDKKVANQIFFRHFTYRDMAKRGGHAFNYYASAYTISKHLHIPKEVAERFGRQYFRAFPGLHEWQLNTIARVQDQGYLDTPLERRRYFLGRLRDDTTLREAIAFVPQSMIGDILNIGMWRVWKHYPEVLLLGQVHDSILIEFPERWGDKGVAPILKECLEVDVPVGPRVMRIPTDFESGWNWGKYNADEKKGALNLDGLGTPNTKRKYDPSAALLDQPIR